MRLRSRNRLDPLHLSRLSPFPHPIPLAARAGKISTNTSLLLRRIKLLRTTTTRTKMRTRRLRKRGRWRWRNNLRLLDCRARRQPQQVRRLELQSARGNVSSRGRYHRVRRHRLLLLRTPPLLPVRWRPLAQHPRPRAATTTTTSSTLAEERCLLCIWLSTRQER